MGVLNIASLGLLVGAMGQFWFYGRLFPHIPTWIVWGVLFLPWLTVFTISFCNRAPFGARPFRLCLIVVMCWYAVVSLLAEAIQFFLHLPADGHFPVTTARVLMYFGAFSFIVFIRACIVLRRYETEMNA
jgi:hypothetical protein